MIDTSKPGAVANALLRHLAVGTCLTVGQMAEELGITSRQATDAAGKLLRRRYLQKMARGCFELSEAGAAAAAAGLEISSGPIGKTGAVSTHRHTFRERAWIAMRIQRRFTIGQIVASAARKGEANARENARKYLVHLCQAGFVRELPSRMPGTSMGSNGFKRFMLVRDTGPRAPVYRASLRAMHDFNKGEDVPCVPS